MRPSQGPTLHSSWLNSFLTTQLRVSPLKHQLTLSHLSSTTHTRHLGTSSRVTVTSSVDSATDPLEKIFNDDGGSPREKRGVFGRFLGLSSSNKSGHLILKSTPKLFLQFHAHSFRGSRSDKSEKEKEKAEKIEKVEKAGEDSKKLSKSKK